jgi:hypothetical protein
MRLRLHPANVLLRMQHAFYPREPQHMDGNVNFRVVSTENCNIDMELIIRYYIV